MLVDIAVSKLLLRSEPTARQLRIFHSSQISAFFLDVFLGGDILGLGGPDHCDVLHFLADVLVLHS